MDPGAVALLALLEFLYLRAVRVLRARGYRVSRLQQGFWHVGIGLQAASVIGPLETLDNQVLTIHMAQHLLLGDIAAPFLLAGLRTPLLQFFLPRSALVPLARRHGLRRVLSFLARPMVAIPFYLLLLYGWHFAFLFEAALRHPALHALQHLSFVAGAIAVWWSAIEPDRRRMRGELWKIPYIFAMRMLSMFLGVALLVMRTPAYGAFYGDSARRHGLTPLSDQQLAGGLMMTVDILIMVGALIVFFARAAADEDRADAASVRSPVGAGGGQAWSEG